MIEVGYAVYDIKNNKVVGIVGLGLNATIESKKYYDGRKESEYDIRPIFVGSPVPDKVLKPITLTKGSVKGAA